jgi:hypothetical protein
MAARDRGKNLWLHKGPRKTMAARDRGKIWLPETEEYYSCKVQRKNYG